MSQDLRDKIFDVISEHGGMEASEMLGCFASIIIVGVNQIDEVGERNKLVDEFCQFVKSHTSKPS
jgi:hypothetical protein